jgi:hypothetical protein
MLIWVIAGAATASHPGANCVQQLGSQACQDATNAGVAIGVSLLIMLWVFGDIILGVLWFVTRGRSCQVCGRSVRRGLVACKGCGYDFRVGASVTSQ